MPNLTKNPAAVNGADKPVERLEKTEPDIPECLTPREVADRLSLSERTVRSYLSSGELPSIKFGRARRIPVDGLRSFVQERRES